MDVASFGGPTAVISLINQHLPSDIRAFDVVRVTRQFNSKNFCSGRRYGYLLPTWVLASRATTRPVAKFPSVPESIKKDYFACRFMTSKHSSLADPATFPQLLTHALASDPFCNGTSASKAAREIREARAIANKADSLSSNLLPATTLVMGRKPPDQGLAVAVAAASVLQQLPPPDDYQTGASAVRAAAELRRVREDKNHPVSEGDFRLSGEAFSRLQGLLGCYKGTKAFHNFTPRLSAGDATTVRYIMDVTSTPPFLIKGCEYVHITIVGQSFMLNQIRHMVGLVVDVMRGAAPEHIMQWAFSAGHLKLPLAPAEGLYLDQCFFEAYDKRYGSDGEHRPITSLAPTPAALCKSFKEESIWPHMAQATAGEGVVSSRSCSDCTSSGGTSAREKNSKRGGPFHDFIKGLDDEPIVYRLRYRGDILKVLEVAEKRHALGVKRGREGEEVGEGEASLFVRLQPALDSVIHDGGALSKVAKEKKEWMRKLKEAKGANKSAEGSGVKSSSSSSGGVQTWTPKRGGGGGGGETWNQSKNWRRGGGGRR